MMDEINDIFTRMAGAERRLDAGQLLFERGAGVEAVYLVVEGMVVLCRYGEDGDPVVLQRARAGDILAEASIFSERYHCSAVAEDVTRLLPVSARRLRRVLAEDPALTEALMRHMGRELRHARMRAEILSLKTVRQRLGAWREWQGGALPLRGKWRSLAGELGVSPEALYREMARLRHEGETDEA